MQHSYADTLPCVERAQKKGLPSTLEHGKTIPHKDETQARTNHELTSQQVADWRTSKSKHHQQMCCVHWPGFDPTGLLTWSRNGSGLKNSEHM